MKQQKHIVSIPVFLGCILLIQTMMMVPVQAQIYKCTNKQGEVYYNDKPCPVESEEKKIKNVKDPVSGYIPPAFVAQQPSEKTSISKSASHTGKAVVALKDKEKSKDFEKGKGSKSPKFLSGENGLKSASAGGGKFASNNIDNALKVPPSGNYSQRERTLKDKLIYLGIEKNTE